MSHFALTPFHNDLVSHQRSWICLHCLFPIASVLRGVSTRGDDAAPDSFIGFDSVPDKVADGSVVRVRYRCSRPCRLAVEVVLSTLRKTDLVVFRRKWISGTPQTLRVRRVLLRLPLSVSHRRRHVHGSAADAQNVTLQAWLDDLKGGGEIGSAAGIHKVQRVVRLSLWPGSAPAECPSWSAQLEWLTSNDRIHQCPYETDVVDLLKFPLASTGERFGVVRRFRPFISDALERVRLHAVTEPSTAFSVWIYLLKWCQKKHCGIIHHVDKEHLFDSVLMQLSETGDIIIQARLTTGEDEAFRTHLMLPLWKWIRLDCYILDSKVLLNVTWDAKSHRFEYVFRNSIHFDDTDGYFVIGGGRYMPGFAGYFGPFKYYRLGTDEIRNQLHPMSTAQELDRAQVACQEMRTLAKAFLHQVVESRLLSPTDEAVCSNDPLRRRGQFDSREAACTQTWSVETQQKHATLFRFLQGVEEIIQRERLGVRRLGSVLFELTVGAVFLVEGKQMKIPSESMVLLQASSCFGNHRASLLLATIYLSGLGRPADQEKGHAYSLIGAAGDDRFALMHAGFKHAHGLDGFPQDSDVAYGYYSNVGSQSSIDRSRIHEHKQYTPHFIYLGNEDDLNSLTDESSDVFRYLQYQAERGDLESQRRLGTMLYWGQNGVSKDIASAVKWFERSAMQMKDPEAVYDYSILLMKGQGVKRNYTQGFQLLKKAAAMGSINALNGLGWYHGIVLKDHRNAAKYFEQAALNGSDDGMFNLGIYHLTGENPDKPWRNESAAFEQFLNASRFGHAAASVEAAWYLSTGSLRGVSPDVERAVTLLQNVCKRNGHLGFMMREALQAHLQGAWEEALVKYILAAETGLGLAQSNAAHLCEELGVGYDCRWRYRNHSILNSDPHPSTLLEIGDYYYYSSAGTRGNSLSLAEQAVSMYSRAALAGSPQGMFNLAVLAQKGHVLPRSVLDFFNASRGDGVEAVMEKILNRCAEIEDDEAVTPCSVALLGLQMGRAWRSVTQSQAQLLLAYAAIVSIFVFVAVVSLQGCLERSSRASAPRRRTPSVSQTDRADDPGRAAGSSWLTVNERRRLSQAGDLAVTLSGACLTAFWTTLLYHLLQQSIPSTATQ
ncbi:protein sel-1 homolog 3 isoform X2 [Xiphophorus couchianus]|uniref:protein sel-1 homolog 3 isoform X2 n=1 Tax=Xiphophorus couchianus TaxID=32473 RepID=UPI00101711FA|nr:protein sel-1 homolog 3-like isoform X2 [Xiphophorus couchianus]